MEKETENKKGGQESPDIDFKPAYPVFDADDAGGAPQNPDPDFFEIWQSIREQKKSFSEKESDPGLTRPFAPPRQAKRKKGKGKKVAFALLVCALLYVTAVFSDIPFIEKWRAIYIETAMGTLHHHWLATAFIPKGVIDQVMENASQLDESQSGASSDWKISPFSVKKLYQPWKKLKKDFPGLYPEIEKDSFLNYLDKEGEDSLLKDGYLVIDKAGLKDGGTPVKTQRGDQVLAIDTQNGISIVKITGEGYVARMAIVKDPSRVGIGVSKDLGKAGAVLAEMADYNDAVLAINASGFDDPGGHGNGGTVYGLVISGGKLLNKPAGGTYKTIALDTKNKLYIGSYPSSHSFRDGVEFKPVLILNGKKMVSGSAGWGIQPRSAVGQTKNGEILLLIVDGRAPGYSIGCTVGEMADIMADYGAVQACNLDGGSSSLLYYNGREISRPSAANKQIGRRIPDGFMVYKRS